MTNQRSVIANPHYTTSVLSVGADTLVDSDVGGLEAVHYRGDFSEGCAASAGAKSYSTMLLYLYFDTFLRYLTWGG